MKHVHLFVLSLCLLAYTACTTSGTTESNTEPAEEDNSTAVESAPADDPPALDVPAIVATIDSQRAHIEAVVSKGIEPITITTDELREKISQKWSKLHVYVKDGAVIRIKSYPHESISQRTEEFYYEDEQLILAVVEDKGMASDERGREKGQIDKLFYYMGGDHIYTVFQNEEKEETSNPSEKLELQDEAKEYLEIYKKYQQ